MCKHAPPLSSTYASVGEMLHDERGLYCWQNNASALAQIGCGGGGGLVAANAYVLAAFACQIFKQAAS